MTREERRRHEGPDLIENGSNLRLIGQNIKRSLVELAPSSLDYVSQGAEFDVILLPFPTLLHHSILFLRPNPHLLLSQLFHHHFLVKRSLCEIDQP